MFEIVMGIDDFLIQLVKYCSSKNEELYLSVDGLMKEIAQEEEREREKL